LLFRRQAGKTLQTLPQLLLPLRRQVLKLPVVLQCAFLFPGWKVFVTSQPIAGMALLLMSLPLLRLWRLAPLLLRFPERIPCGMGRQSREHRDGKDSSRRVIRYVSGPPQWIYLSD
jgi:hypothetical protein